MAWSDGDEKQHPRFIETVPRRGYRFIAKVTEASKVNISENGAGRTVALPAAEQRDTPAPWFKNFVMLVAAAVILSALSIGFWYARSKDPQPTAPILSASFSSEKLSTNGKVVYAAISPDGKNVVYTSGTGRDKQSVWLRQIETGNNIQIIPPSDESYGGLAVSPDGNLLYFTRRREPHERFAIYRVSLFGGIPIRIAGDAHGAISLSPDGKTISFVRCARANEDCSLWIADAADGKNARKLTSRPAPFRIEANKISPDGELVAFACGQSENAGNEFGLVEIDIKNGKERALTSEKFFDIRSLSWLPDRSGLLITAARIPNKRFRIWQVSAATGAVQPLTKDSETYFALSLDKMAGLLVSTQVKADFRLRLFNLENPSNNQVLADALTVAFAPNERIVFSSAMSGNDEIWSINADGSEQRQLTNDAADDTTPVASPDNSAVFFSSNRTGAAHVWRMNTDGSNQTQLTFREGGFPLFTSPDGKWIYYHHGLNRTLWRVAVKGGEEQPALNQARNYFALSPEGGRVAFAETEGEAMVLTIASLVDGQTLNTFPLTDRTAELRHVAWLPDAKNLVYISVDREGGKTLWLQPLDGHTPRKLAALGDEGISDFALSPDGKKFAVAQGSWRHDAVLMKGLR